MWDDKESRPDKIVLNAMSKTRKKETSQTPFKGKVTKKIFAEEIMSRLPLTINIKRGV